MYTVTQVDEVGLFSSSLHNILHRCFPDADIAVENSALLYDELMRGDTSSFADQNESYILTKAIHHHTLVVDIVCLHMESLRITILTAAEVLNERRIDAFFSEIKILLLTEAIKYQSQMFSKISDNSWHLASGLSHEVVTQHVIEGALKTIAYSDAAIFRIYDEKNAILVPVAMSGFKDNYYDYAVSLNESISGRVFQSQKSIVLNSREDILHSFTATSPLRDEIMKDNPVATSLLCVPVYDQQSCYGTLTILSFSRQFVFNSLAQSLLETFSSQVALAWRNARLYDERTESLRVVEVLRNQLQAQNTLLTSSVNLYNTMVSLSIKFNRLDEFINAMSETLALELNYLDVLGNQCLSEEASALTWRDLNQLDRTSAGLIPLAENDSYCALPLENEGRLLAFFIMKKAQLNDSLFSIISRLKEFVIMEIFKRASSVTVENKKTLSLIENICTTGLTADLEMDLTRRGLILHKSVLCIKLESATMENDDIHYLAAIHALSRDFFIRNTLYYFEGNVITALVSDASEQKLLAIENKLSSAYQSAGDYKIGVSAVLKRHEIASSIKQARVSLDVLKTRNKRGVMSFKNAGIDRLLIKHTSQELRDFIIDTLSPVLDRDDKAAFLLDTVICYLKNRQSAVNTADELNIHVNTLYQRIKKFETLTRLSLNNPDDFLMISLTCHMSRFYLQ